MAEEAAVRQRVRLGMGPEGGKVVGGAGSPGGEGTDAAGSMIAAESTPRARRRRSMLGDSRRASGSFSRDRTVLRGHVKNLSEHGVRDRNNCSASGTAIDCGDRGRSRATNLPQGAAR